MKCIAVQAAHGVLYILGRATHRHQSQELEAVRVQLFEQLERTASSSTTMAALEIKGCNLKYICKCTAIDGAGRGAEVLLLLSSLLLCCFANAHTDACNEIAQAGLLMGLHRCEQYRQIDRLTH